jgi:GTP diphosphokinase / guanosine-3',5'-bis(diphosphate) 3'-diphosphatase
MIRFEEILEKVQVYNPGSDETLLRKAYVFSAKEHHGQTRRSGEPYLIHPLNVAGILADMRADDVSIVVGLLHDILEDTGVTKEDLTRHFGAEVAELVDGVTKIGKFTFHSREQEQAETFLKMILGMASDLRVILVKLADRLHNMRTLEFLPPEKRDEVSRETLEIYAPIANRLGIGSIKGELEDLAFHALEPDPYQQISQAVEARLKNSRRVVEDIQRRIESALSAAGIENQVRGRVKRLYSIWLKMKRQEIEVAQLYDILAFRIVCREVKDCYAILGLIHQIWRPVPGRFKDYIAMPKPNFYQSLHTTVMGEKGTPFEVQVRTYEMDLLAERGIAAHWRYKEGRLDASPEDARFDWLRRLADLRTEVSDPRQFLDALKVDLYPDEVYTFTPKGKVFAFPRGATPVDFAYRVHSDVGAHCIGSRVNGKLVPLKTPLQNGDWVEILTSPAAKPSRDWLSFAVTSRAKNKIRHFIHAQEKEKSIEIGRKLLEKEFKRFKRSVKKLESDGALADLLPDLGLSKIEDLYAALGFGKLVPRSIVEKLVPAEEINQTPAAEPESALGRAARKILPFGSPTVEVVGYDDLLASLAKCCNPLPGEPIVGYVTRGRGVSVHAATCPNVTSLLYDPDRQIQVCWSGKKAVGRFPAELRISTEDRSGLLADLTQVIAEEKSNIRRIEARSDAGRGGEIHVVVEIDDVKHLDKILKRLRAVSGVLQVRRQFQTAATSDATPA